MNPQRKIKVGYITEIPTPYRLPMLKLLSEQPEVDLRVYFCSGTQFDRQWKVQLDHSFKYTVMKDYGFIASRKYSFVYRINPKIVSELFRQKFDLVVVPGYAFFTAQAAILFCWLTRTPYFIQSESHLFRNRSVLKQVLKQIFLRPVVQQARGGLVTGTYAHDYLVHYGMNPERVFIFPNTCDIAYFGEESDRCRLRKEELKTSYGIRAKKNILYVGRMVEVKEVDFLIRAFRNAKKEDADLGLILVGDGPLFSIFQEMCKQEHIDDVVFLGFRPVEEMPAIYSTADLFVLPSSDEPWGVVVNEAMACGLPVIVTQKVGAGGDLVDEGANGYIVKERSVGELYLAIKKFFALSEPKRRQMGESSRKKISVWSYQLGIDQFLEAVRAFGALEKPREKSPCSSV